MLGMLPIWKNSKVERNRLYDQLIDISKLQKQDRSTPQCKRVSQVLSQMPFFQRKEFKRLNLTTLVSTAQYLKLDQGQIICTQPGLHSSEQTFGDSESAYLLVSGNMLQTQHRVKHSEIIKPLKEYLCEATSLTPNYSQLKFEFEEPDQQQVTLKFFQSQVIGDDCNEFQARQLYETYLLLSANCILKKALVMYETGQKDASALKRSILALVYKKMHSEIGKQPLNQDSNKVQALRLNTQPMTSNSKRDLSPEAKLDKQLKKAEQTFMINLRMKRKMVLSSIKPFIKQSWIQILSKSDEDTFDTDSQDDSVLPDLPKFKFGLGHLEFQHTGDGHFERLIGTKERGSLIESEQLLKYSAKQQYYAKTVYTCESKFCELVVFKRREFQTNLQKELNEHKKQKVQFLLQLPQFAQQRLKVLNMFCEQMKSQKYTFGQQPYRQGQPATHVYIVVRGEFLLTRSVRDEKVIGNFDMPSEQHLTLCGEGYLLGEEDILSLSRKKYSSTLTCQSQQGKLYAIKQELFLAQLRGNTQSWHNVLKRVIYKEGKNLRHDENQLLCLKPTPSVKMEEQHQSTDDLALDGQSPSKTILMNQTTPNETENYFTQTQTHESQAALNHQETTFKLPSNDYTSNEFLRPKSKTGFSTARDTIKILNTNSIQTSTQHTLTSYRFQSKAPSQRAASTSISLTQTQRNNSLTQVQGLISSSALENNVSLKQFLESKYTSPAKKVTNQPPQLRPQTCVMRQASTFYSSRKILDPISKKDQSIENKQESTSQVSFQGLPKNASEAQQRHVRQIMARLKKNQ